MVTTTIKAKPESPAAIALGLGEPAVRTKDVLGRGRGSFGSFGLKLLLIIWRVEVVVGIVPVPIERTRAIRIILGLRNIVSLGRPVRSIGLVF